MTESKLKNNGKIGVSNLILDEKGRILLMKRPEQCHTFPGVWGLVGGFVDWGENPIEALEREAMEEIGVRIKMDRFIGRYYSTPHPREKTIISLPHYSHIVSGVPHPAQPEECSDVRWFTPEEVRGMDLAYDHKQILKDEGLI